MILLTRFNPSELEVPNLVTLGLEELTFPFQLKWTCHDGFRFPFNILQTKNSAKKRPKIRGIALLTHESETSSALLKGPASSIL